MVARWAHNPKVIGSNPFSATKEAQQSLSLYYFSQEIITPKVCVLRGRNIFLYSRDRNACSCTLPLRHALEHCALAVGHEVSVEGDGASREVGVHRGAGLVGACREGETDGSR